MKKTCLIIIVSIAAFTSCGPSIQSTDINYEASEGYGTFYDALSPYGRWFDYPGYGYVWAPRVEMGFSPYATNGHWVYSAEGWVWASGYNWGWAPFHYGRWFYDGPYGWMWMPGNQWAPAWVTWGSCNGYYGWAPMMPHGGVSVSAYWNFVPAQHVGQVNVNNYIVRNNTTVVNNLSKNVTVINNNYAAGDNRQVTGRAAYNRGPEVRDVEKATGRRINPIVVQTTGKPGEQLNDRRLAIYRPVIREGTPKRQMDNQSGQDNRQITEVQPQQNNATTSPAQQERKYNPASQAPGQEKKRVDQAPQPQQDRPQQQDRRRYESLPPQTSEQDRRRYNPTSQSREQGERYNPPAPPVSRQDRRPAPANQPLQQERRFNRMPSPAPSGNWQGRGNGNERDTRKSRKKDDR